MGEFDDAVQRHLAETDERARAWQAELDRRAVAVTVGARMVADEFRKVAEYVASKRPPETKAKWISPKGPPRPTLFKPNPPPYHDMKTPPGWQFDNDYVFLADGNVYTVGYGTRNIFAELQSGWSGGGTCYLFNRAFSLRPDGSVQVREGPSDGPPHAFSELSNFLVLLAAVLTKAS